MRHIDKIGVEVEGGWLTPPGGEYIIHQDVSVKNGTDGFAQLIAEVKGKKVICSHWGEIASKPFSTLGEVEAFLKVYHPVAVNKSCGFHVHISVKKVINYTKLMSRNFFASFLSAATEWGKEVKLPESHPFWDRVKGGSRFAKKEFRPIAQLGILEKDGGRSGWMGRDTRRTLLNYCWAMHGTLECRLFPGWASADEAFGAAEFFTNFVDDYLKRKRRKMHLSTYYAKYTVKRLERLRVLKQ